MSRLKYWTAAWIIGLSMIFFLGTGVCGTYIYYNEDGKVVRYRPKQKKVTVKTKKITVKPYGDPPGEKPYKPRHKSSKK